MLAIYSFVLNQLSIHEIKVLTTCWHFLFFWRWSSNTRAVWAHTWFWLSAFNRGKEILSFASGGTLLAHSEIITFCCKERLLPRGGGLSLLLGVSVVWTSALPKQYFTIFIQLLTETWQHVPWLLRNTENVFVPSDGACRSQLLVLDEW